MKVKRNKIRGWEGTTKQQLFTVHTYSPIFGVWTFDVLTFFEVSLQVHGEQWGAGGVVGAAYWPIVTTGLMVSAKVRWRIQEE